MPKWSIHDGNIDPGKSLKNRNNFRTYKSLLFCKVFFAIMRLSPNEQSKDSLRIDLKTMQNRCSKKRSLNDSQNNKHCRMNQKWKQHLSKTVQTSMYFQQSIRIDTWWSKSRQNRRPELDGCHGRGHKGNPSQRD